MASGDRKRTPAASDVTVNGKESIGGVDETEVKKLRERWELASVLNFLNVFEPLIGGDLKITAEEIEAALINPNSVLAHLHITLLKGIPPVSRNMSDSDVWITALCKKLALWWPWVAEGEIPIRAAKGEEIGKYKELDPVNRLVLLKALCEIRATQHDTVSYVNDALKNGTQLSSFRKNRIGEDGKGSSYWCDGNKVIGYRLYREVKSDSRTKTTSKETFPAVCYWETLATNLQEFQKVVDELSSSKTPADLAVAKAIESDPIPVLEKFHKAKERKLKQKQRQEMLLNNARNIYAAGTTRTCRNRRPVSYTFDDYDRTIEEAIQQTKTQQRPEGNRNKHGKGIDDSSAEIADVEKDFSGASRKRGGSMDSDTKSNMHQVIDSDGEAEDEFCNSDDENGNGVDHDHDRDHGLSNSKKEISILADGNHAATLLQEQAECDSQSQTKAYETKRVTELTMHYAGGARSPGAKNRLRQRPIQNSALECVVSDSEDDS